MPLAFPQGVPPPPESLPGEAVHPPLGSPEASSTWVLYRRPSEHQGLSYLQAWSVLLSLQGLRAPMP